jgi:hypothetical protein
MIRMIATTISNSISEKPCESLRISLLYQPSLANPRLFPSNSSFWPAGRRQPSPSFP